MIRIISDEEADEIWKEEVGVSHYADLTSEKREGITTYLERAYYWDELTEDLKKEIQKDLCNRLEGWEDFGSINYQVWGITVKWNIAACEERMCNMQK